MKVNDLVTRYSHGHDIVFEIKMIHGDTAVLEGKVMRLICDSPINDLKIYDKGDTDLCVPICPNLQRTKEKRIFGKVLHLDGDEYYLKKAMEAYRNYHVKATGYYVTESEMPKVIRKLLLEHRPDVLVLTGHDALKTNNKDKLEDLTSYKNSYNFVIAVDEARKLISDKDQLVIIAGACQSNYEKLIDAGANFASSPTRKNIHLLDPIIIATQVASGLTDEYLDINVLLEQTISRGIGGIDTKGKARRIYLGGTSNDNG